MVFSLLQENVLRDNNTSKSVCPSKMIQHLLWSRDDLKNCWVNEAALNIVVPMKLVLPLINKIGKKMCWRIELFCRNSTILSL